MKISIPKERKELEKRVAITPDGVKQAVAAGHEVIVEAQAGIGSGFSDAEYLSAGARIEPSLEKLWKQADLLVKVKEPAPEEYQYFRPDLMLFDYLHAASMPELTRALQASGIASLAYELVRTSDGRMPLLEPMSEIAGKLSVLNGSNFLLSQNLGKGILIAGAVGVAPAQVLVIGAGIAGSAAASMAVGMGASVIVSDIRPERVKDLQDKISKSIKYLSAADLESELPQTDLLIGAVLVPGAKAPKIISRKQISLMKPGSVFVDISIDQGGCAETIKPTSLSNPVYLEEGVVHYGVCNMPAQVPQTATKALTNATLPFILEIANKGRSVLFELDTPLGKSIVTQQGTIVNEQVRLAIE